MTYRVYHLIAKFRFEKNFFGFPFQVALSNMFFKQKWTREVLIFFNSKILHQEIVRKFLKFCMTGVVGVSISYGIFYILLKKFSIHYLTSSMTGIVIGSFVVFFINRQWTFNTTSEGYSQHSQRFVVLVVTTYILNGFSIYTLTELGRLIPEISQIITIGITTIYNFLLSNFWVFKKPK